MLVIHELQCKRRIIARCVLRLAMVVSHSFASHMLSYPAHHRRHKNETPLFELSILQSHHGGPVNWNFELSRWIWMCTFSRSLSMTQCSLNDMPRTGFFHRAAFSVSDRKQSTRCASIIEQFGFIVVLEERFASERLVVVFLPVDWKWPPVSNGAFVFTIRPEDWRLAPWVLWFDAAFFILLLLSSLPTICIAIFSSNYFLAR